MSSPPPSQEPRPPVVAVVGATATGKSALAMALARRMPAEIVNADALQVYRGLDIGTAKPSLEDRRAVRHHLVDVLDPSEAFSAGRFAELAGVHLDEIRDRGGVALVVGGSGLYLDALFEGLAPLPEVDPRLRRRLEAELDERGLAVLVDELGRVDPATASTIDLRNPRRVLRALEIFRQSGRPLSAWLAEQGAPPRRAPVWIGVRVERGELHRRIEERTDRMLAAGWVDEVAALQRDGISPSAPAFQAIGYRQIAAFLEGGLSREALREEILTATRRYAKRQETWFRRRSGVRWLDGAGATATQADIVCRLVGQGEDT